MRGVEVRVKWSAVSLRVPFSDKGDGEEFDDEGGSCKWTRTAGFMVLDCRAPGEELLGGWEDGE